mmetsp:Transcript_43716/g.131038  ORF Transcript_43716/g.131038 Transcript_43716/m.131038 type:complete len:234 (-) Transcript_43716:302-1003(-)
MLHLSQLLFSQLQGPPSFHLSGVFIFPSGIEFCNHCSQVDATSKRLTTHILFKAPGGASYHVDRRLRRLTLKPMSSFSQSIGSERGKVIPTAVRTDSRLPSRRSRSSNSTPVGDRCKPEPGALSILTPRRAGGCQKRLTCRSGSSYTSFAAMPVLAIGTDVDTLTRVGLMDTMSLILRRHTGNSRVLSMSSASPTPMSSSGRLAGSLSLPKRTFRVILMRAPVWRKRCVASAT